MTDTYGLAGMGGAGVGGSNQGILEGEDLGVSLPSLGLSAQM